jgi:hypothetical protein
MTGYPSTLYLNIPAVGSFEGGFGANGFCTDFPDSFTVPLWYNSAPIVPILGTPSSETLGAGWVGWYINPRGYYDVAGAAYADLTPAQGPILGGGRVNPVVVYCHLVPCSSDGNPGNGTFLLKVFAAIQPFASPNFAYSEADTLSLSVETAVGLDLVYTTTHFFVNTQCAGGFATITP